jgi:mRNA-degrading endonuclease RelE of RelBE toxin-antitoxin system
MACFPGSITTLAAVNLTSMFPVYRYTAMPYSAMVFIESSLFERYLPRYLSDEEFGRLQMALRDNPALGVLIPGSGGIRKLRWGRRGMGKRGGVRVIYYWNPPHEIWLLTIYAKGEVETIPPHILRTLKREMENGPTKNE